MPKSQAQKASTELATAFTRADSALRTEIEELELPRSRRRSSLAEGVGIAERTFLAEQTAIRQQDRDEPWVSGFRWEGLGPLWRSHRSRRRTRKAKKKKDRKKRKRKRRRVTSSSDVESPSDLDQEQTKND